MGEDSLRVAAALAAFDRTGEEVADVGSWTSDLAADDPLVAPALPHRRVGS